MIEVCLSSQAVSSLRVKGLSIYFSFPDLAHHRYSVHLCPSNEKGLSESCAQDLLLCPTLHRAPTRLELPAPGPFVWDFSAASEAARGPEDPSLWAESHHPARVLGSGGVAVGVGLGWEEALLQLWSLFCPAWAHPCLPSVGALGNGAKGDPHTTRLNP